MVALALDKSPDRRPVEVSPARIEQGHFKRSLRVLKEVYDAAGSHVIAGATGVDTGDLSKMFAPTATTTRYFRFESVFPFARYASREQAIRIVEPLATCFGLHITDRPVMTAEEKCIRYEQVIEMLGPLAEALRDRVMGVVPKPEDHAAKEAELAAANARVRALEEQIHAFQQTFLAGGRP